jgi:hypothetical protein
MTIASLFSLRDFLRYWRSREILSLIAIATLISHNLGCDSNKVPVVRARDAVPQGTIGTPDPWQLVAPPVNAVARQTPRDPQPDDWFNEPDTGTTFAYGNGREGNKFTLMESIGGGVALFDADGDELPDVFITGGGLIEGSPITVAGLPDAFFRNLGEFHFTDVGTNAGLAFSANYTVGCSVCDFNCDGYPDLFVTGYPHCAFYCNQGDGTFREMSDSETVADVGLHAASAWGDFDGDGLPDVFVSGYVTFDLREDRNCGEDLRGIRDICGIWQYPPAPDRIYRNLGDGRFLETTSIAGLRADGKGLGAVAADINGDQALDLYVANDFTANFLYLGDGRGAFRERGLESGAALDENGAPQGSMGVDFGDYDGDGRGDLFVTNYQLEDNILYRNQGDGLFSVAAHAGLEGVCRPYVGFGTGWVDFDSDGWQDLFVLNGHVMYHTGQSSYEQPQFLFQNVGGTRFENRSADGGPYFSIRHVARGGAVGDLNNDGTPDLVVVHQNAPVSFLRNQKIPTRWVSLCLHGINSDPFGVGAVVTARFLERELVRYVRSGAGYLSHFDRRILIPVDENQPAACTVRWLNGRQEIFQNLLPGQTHHLIEGHGE